MSDTLEEAKALYQYLWPDCGGCETCIRMFDGYRQKFDELVKQLTEEEQDELFKEG